MKVARQLIAWYPCENRNRPVGYGMIGSDRRATIGTINQPGVGIRPCPTGRILDWTYDNAAIESFWVTLKPSAST